MIKAHVRTLLGAGCVSLAATGIAAAGGLERGGYNIDLLFDPARVAAEATSVYVSPQRNLENARDTDPTDGLGSNGLNGGARSVRDTDDYWIPRVGLKVGIVEGIDCMIDYSQPWGADLNPGANWVGANHNIQTVVNSDNYAGTCSYKFQAGPGQLRFIGGAYYQELDGFKERLIAPIPLIAQSVGFPTTASGVGRLDLETDGWGWRAGFAYEIPEIALRASLVYNSEVKLDSITGTVDLTQVPQALIPGGNPIRPIAGRTTDVFGSAEMPQSVELKLQSGIAPDWLAFGSVKWTDWSVLQAVSFCSTAIQALNLACTYRGPGFITSLDLVYRDGWTVTGGIGHKFTETISGAASITWDRGTSTGLGTQTDTWTFAGGASYTPNQNIEVRLGGAVGILTSGSSGVVVANGFTYGTDVAYDFGNDFVGALSGSFKLKF